MSTEYKKDKLHALTTAVNAYMVCKGRSKMTEGATRLQIQPDCEPFAFLVFSKLPRFDRRGIQKVTMHDYQLDGLNWLIGLYECSINGILADDMGLGKKLQAISLLGYLLQKKLTVGPHLIVVQKSSIDKWMKEFVDFCPSLHVVKFWEKNQYERKKKANLLDPRAFNVCLTTVDMAKLEKKTLSRISWHYIIIYEAQQIKNEDCELSKSMRQYTSSNRLLITGTPIQNNLHELWALLNFVEPEVFSSTFEECFQISGSDPDPDPDPDPDSDSDSDSDFDFDPSGENGFVDPKVVEVLPDLYKVVCPFLLRRLKSNGKSLPRKKETIIKVALSKMQREHYCLGMDGELHRKGEPHGYRDIHLQKLCNHPNSLKGAEARSPYPNGDHLIKNSGKMVLLDKLLQKLKERDSRVLIFSQKTELLDILEGYLKYSGYQFCRIDGRTPKEDRDASIEDFNKPGSDKFVFLLSTKAVDRGINLTTADVVILYDSDCVPQADLKAQGCAHRIGQKKEVQVFRFCTEHTIELRTINIAYKKLWLSALFSEQGRLAEQETVNKDGAQKLAWLGAEYVFSSKDNNITDEDIDCIIAKGEETTAVPNAKMRKISKRAIKFNRLKHGRGKFLGDVKVDTQKPVSVETSPSRGSSFKRPRRSPRLRS